MGRVQCKVHGSSGMIMVCPHIHSDVSKRDRTRDVSRITFIDYAESDERFRICHILYYCPICVSAYDFPEGKYERPTHEWRPMYERATFLPECFECFTELTS